MQGYGLDPYSAPIVGAANMIMQGIGQMEQRKEREEDRAWMREQREWQKEDRSIQKQVQKQKDEATGFLSRWINPAGPESTPRHDNVKGSGKGDGIEPPATSLGLDSAQQSPDGQGIAEMTDTALSQVLERSSTQALSQIPWADPVRAEQMYNEMRSLSPEAQMKVQQSIFEYEDMIRNRDMNSMMFRTAKIEYNRRMGLDLTAKALRELQENNNPHGAVQYMAQAHDYAMYNGRKVDISPDGNVSFVNVFTGETSDLDVNLDDPQQVRELISSAMVHFQSGEEYLENARRNSELQFKARQEAYANPVYLVNDQGQTLTMVQYPNPDTLEMVTEFYDIPLPYHGAPQLNVGYEDLRNFTEVGHAKDLANIRNINARTAKSIGDERRAAAGTRSGSGGIGFGLDAPTISRTDAAPFSNIIPGLYAEEGTRITPEMDEMIGRSVNDAAVLWSPHQDDPDFTQDTASRVAVTRQWYNALANMGVDTRMNIWDSMAEEELGGGKRSGGWRKKTEEARIAFDAQVRERAVEMEREFQAGLAGYEAVLEAIAAGVPPGLIKDELGINVNDLWQAFPKEMGGLLLESGDRYRGVPANISKFAGIEREASVLRVAALNGLEPQEVEAAMQDQSRAAQEAFAAQFGGMSWEEFRAHFPHAPEEDVREVYEALQQYRQQGQAPLSTADGDEAGQGEKPRWGVWDDMGMQMFESDVQGQGQGQEEDTMPNRPVRVPHDEALARALDEMNLGAMLSDMESMERAPGAGVDSSKIFEAHLMSLGGELPEVVGSLYGDIPGAAQAFKRWADGMYDNPEEVPAAQAVAEFIQTSMMWAQAGPDYFKFTPPQSRSPHKTDEELDAMVAGHREMFGRPRPPVYGQ